MGRFGIILCVGMAAFSLAASGPGGVGGNFMWVCPADSALNVSLYHNFRAVDRCDDGGWRLDVPASVGRLNTFSVFGVWFPDSKPGDLTYMSVTDSEGDASGLNRSGMASGDVSVQLPWPEGSAVVSCMRRAVAGHRSVRSALFADGFGATALRTADGETDRGDGTPVRVTLRSGRFMRDALGRIVSVRDGDSTDAGALTDYAPADGSLPETTTEYDLFDRVTAVTLPEGERTTTSYTLGDETLTTTVTDPLGRRFSTVSDPLGRTLRTISHDAPEGELTVSYAYDALDRVVAVTDPEGNVTRSTYDMLGRRTAVDHPASGVTRTWYDAAGHITATQNAVQALNATRTLYRHDFDNLVSVTPEGAPADSVRLYYYSTSHPDAANRGRVRRLEEPSGK